MVCHFCPFLTKLKALLGFELRCSEKKATVLTTVKIAT